ncbi:MAG: hypothetical protein FWF97_01515 [Alphaproteobacteria bacterium]|nr:hypothetical protein [Alphaproteobacteria bacterium]
MSNWTRHDLSECGVNFHIDNDSAESNPPVFTDTMWCKNCRMRTECEMYTQHPLDLTPLPMCEVCETFSGAGACIRFGVPRKDNVLSIRQTTSVLNTEKRIEEYKECWQSVKDAYKTK